MAGTIPPPKYDEKVGTKLHSGWWDFSVLGEVSQLFGVLEDLIVNGVHIQQPHSGIDIAMPVGTALYVPVHAVVDGVGTDAYGNNFVKLKMDNGQEVLLLHLHDMAVHVGQDLTAGTLLGHSGDSGLSTGPHLHFEVDQSGKPVDPWSWITGYTGAHQDVPGGGIPNPLDALSGINDFFGHLSNPGHDPCKSPADEQGFFRIIDAVTCPENWWKVLFSGVGFALIGLGVFIYFIKEEKQIAVNVEKDVQAAGEVAAVAA